jgi:hypothetical protein
MIESRRFWERTGSMARSGHVGSIGAHRANRLGHGRACISVPCRIDSNVWVGVRVGRAGVGGIESDAGLTRSVAG